MNNDNNEFKNDISLNFLNGKTKFGPETDDVQFTDNINFKDNSIRKTIFGPEVGDEEYESETKNGNLSFGNEKTRIGPETADEEFATITPNCTPYGKQDNKFNNISKNNNEIIKNENDNEKQINSQNNKQNASENEIKNNILDIKIKSGNNKNNN